MASAKIYAQTFSSEGITRDTMHMLDRTMLKELGIKSMGDVLIILKMTNLSDTQMNIQLYNCAEETVQNSIINTYPEFFNADPSKLLDMLEVLVTMKSNPIVHRISFSSIAQGDSEPSMITWFNSLKLPLCMILSCVIVLILMSVCHTLANIFHFKKHFIT